MVTKDKGTEVSTRATEAVNTATAAMGTVDTAIKANMAIIEPFACTLVNKYRFV